MEEEEKDYSHKSFVPDSLRHIEANGQLENDHEDYLENVYMEC